MNENVKVRISTELKKKINAYCDQNNIENASAFIRYAITEKLTPDIEDETLVFESLKQLHDKQNSVEQKMEIFFSFFCFTVRHFLVYNAELPEQHKEAASASAVSRYNKLFKTFQNSMKNTPSMFESLLADFIGSIDV